MNTNTFRLVVAAAAASFSMGAMAAPAVLDTGTVSMGVADNGGLGALGVGFVGPNGDAIIRGCLCEGWGAAGNGNSGYVYGLGATGINSALLTTTTASGAVDAQSVVTMANGLQVTHTYSTAAGGTLFRVAITMTNTTGAVMTDVRYARTLDWDVAPGYFGSNYTTVYGGPGGASTPGDKLLHTSTNPFAVPDPMVTRAQEADTNVNLTPGDKGGYFIFGFGDLADGASVSFETYIGADPTQAGLLAALSSVGVEAYSFTTGDDRSSGAFAPAFGYGFTGLGLPPALAPEPGTLALVGLALIGGAVARRRRS